MCVHAYLLALGWHEIGSEWEREAQFRVSLKANQSIDGNRNVEH